MCTLLFLQVYCLAADQAPSERQVKEQSRETPGYILE